MAKNGIKAKVHVLGPWDAKGKVRMPPGSRRRGGSLKSKLCHNTATWLDRAQGGVG